MDCTMPLISVIVPIFNTQEYLRQCIDSILNQTYTNLDIILIDDGSTDGSAEICDMYREQDERIRVLHKPNGGLVSARKAGIQLAKGLYVTYVDSDDWMDNTRLFEVYKKGIIYGVDIVSTSVIYEYAVNSSLRVDDNVLEGVYTEKCKGELLNNIIGTDKFYYPKRMLTLWKYVYRRTLLYKIQMNVDDKITIGEDAVCVWQCLLGANSCAVIYGAAYHYRKRANSMMHVERHNERKKIKNIWKTLYPLHKDSEFGQTLERQLEMDLYMELMCSDYKSLMDVNEKFLFPFKHIERGMRIAIYGAGSFGKEIVCFLQETQYCELLIWCDTNYQNYVSYMELYGVAVCNPEILFQESFDYVVLAITNCHVRDEVVKYLIDRGVAKKRIADIEDVECFSHDRLMRALQ